MSLSKNVIKIISAVFTAVIFITAASLLCKPSALDDIVAITVSPSRTVLDSADMKTTYRFDEQTQNYISKSYYNIYDFDNITLTVDYGSYQKDYSGTEIAKLTAQIGAPFIISDGQSDSVWGYGTHTVSYSLGTHTASAVFTVVKSRIESVSIQPQYDINVIYNVDGSYKTVRDAEGNLTQRFIYGLDGFDYAVTLGYIDGSEISCYAADLKYKTGYDAVFSQEDKQLSVGENTGYCTVGGVTASFTFNVIENPIESISLYMTDGADTLYSGSDGYYDERSDGSKFYRFIYDRTKLRAKVNFTDGTAADYPLGELCAVLHKPLIISDMQAVSPWGVGTVTLPAYISGITTSLTLEIIGALPVTGAKVTANEGHSVTLGWSDVSCDGYIIEMYTQDGWSELDRLPSGTVSYKADGLSDITKYKFAVSSYYVNPKTGQEVVTDRCIVPITTNLSSVNGLTASNVTSNSAVLKWNAVSSAEGYIVEQYKNGNWVQISSVSSASVKVSGLTQGSTVNFRVKAYNGAVNSAYSYLTVNTLPANVSGFKLTKRTSSAITLGWSKNANATGYIFEQYKSGKWVRIATITSNSTVSRTVTGLTQGTYYSFRIRAYKTSGGTNVYSGYSYAYISTLPANVSGFKYTKRTATAITLGWSKNANATGYQIEQLKSGKWVRIATITSNSTVSRTVTGL
ncbi:MAG: fibronectin type III domain-containing protein, partial [Ruminiclostridium sp.]